MSRYPASTKRIGRFSGLLFELPGHRERNGAVAGTRPARLPLFVITLLWAIAIESAIGVSAFAQDAAGDGKASIDRALSYLRNDQYDQMFALLDTLWENDLESILEYLPHVGICYAGSKRADILVQRIESISDEALLTRYWSQLQNCTSIVAAYRGQEEAAIRMFDIVLELTPVHSRCHTAREYGDLLRRQSRLEEAYEAYKLGFFPAPSGADGAKLAVPSQRDGMIRQTGEVLSPFTRLADLTQEMEAEHRLRADVKKAIEEMPKWKPGGDLLLAMLSRRAGDEGPLTEIGTKCLEDPAYRASMATLISVLRQELSMCTRSEPLDIAAALWRELAESGEDFRIDGALHQQAFIELKKGNREQARQLWMKIVDRSTDEERSPEHRFRSLTFASEQLEKHEFPLDALLLIPNILHTDRSSFSEHNDALYEIWRAERRLVQILDDARADQFAFAKAAEDQVLATLLELYLGKPPEKEGDSGSELREKTAIVVGETILALAASSKKLAELRPQWDAHPLADSLKLLALRAEAAMTAGDSGAAERLLARIAEVERTTGQAAPLWSLACLFFGLEEKLKVEFRHDLAGGELDKKIFGIAGKVRPYVQSGPDGLCLRSPPNFGPLGVGFRFPLRGDFEVTASYVIPPFTPPDEIGGCGASLRVASRNAKRELAGYFAVNGLKADEGGRYVMIRNHRESGDIQSATETANTSSRSGRLPLIHKGNTHKGNTRHQSVTETAKTSSHSGRLRFIRKGNTLHFLAAEGDRAPFRRLHHVPFTAEDTTDTRVGVQSVDPSVGMEVRWKDLVIRAEEIVGLPAETRLASTEQTAHRSQGTKAPRPGGAQPSGSGVSRSFEAGRSKPSVTGDSEASGLGDSEASGLGGAEASRPESQEEKPRNWWWVAIPFLILTFCGTGAWWALRAKKARSK